MASVKYDVVIVGAGPAGITAAIALAKANIPVLVIECGAFPGAENWSGAVYFTENLAQPDVLGEQAVRDSAYERPVTKRGIHIYNGHSLVGLTYRNPETFRHCYTVLRPTYDHYLAELAKSFGAKILTETTVTGLLRKDTGKITGVQTDRGPVYADVVFLAEGDASHLVTKEGYERCKGEPHFLQGIAEVIELAPDEIERRFELPRGEGAALEIVLRNPGKMRLNMGGFIYTNAASVSLGLVVPLDNLSKEFRGDHNQLMEWFKSLPEIRRWVGDGRSVAYGAKLIRGGGIHELPQLVDHGLALGGACTGIGLDFPYPNFTGPATAMGRLFAQAVRQANGDFSRERLTELYEQPLRQTHYFKNIEFLEHWPHYVEHTRVFFGRAADLACGSLYIATHPELHTGQKFWQLAKFLRETLPPKHWKEFFADLREQRVALGLNRIVGAPFRAGPADGEVTLDFFVDAHPRPLPRFLARPPAAACDHLYRNDDTPLPIKLHRAIRCVHLSRYLALLGISSFVALLAPIQWLCEMITLLVTRPSPEKYLSSFFQRYRSLTRQRADLETKPRQSWEDKLATIRYSSEPVSHIKVIRPEHFQDRTKLADSPLWHVCPAKVYEHKVDDLGQVQIIVNYENCIKCESCLRAAPADVDWTRQRRQRLIFSSPTEANRKLLALAQSNVTPSEAKGLTTDDSELLRCAQNDKCEQFTAAVYSGPRYIDAGRAGWLKSLVVDAPARVREYAEKGKFFWAAAELDFPIPQPVIQSEAEDLALAKHFSKQTIKDLEHGHRLSDEQLSFLKSLKPDSEILSQLARKDVSFALLVSGIYPAQITANPKLAEVPWIGLTAARTHWRDFPAMAPVTLPRVAEAFRAIVRGAGEMLLERCKTHATSRVQFPGLFKDEDSHDGIAKFGAVKQLLSEMEAQVYLLRHLDADPATIKVTASEAFVTIAYNAGQIIGGSAYSEDDIFAKYYRDSVCLRRMLFDDASLKRQPLKLTVEPVTELEFEISKLLVGAASPARPDVADLGSTIAKHGYIERPLVSPPSFNYRDALQRDQHYDHGDFLTKPFDADEWRYVPEMLHADTELRAYHETLYRYFTDKFWNARFDGQPYYRLVEKAHMIPLADVRDMVAHGFMRMYIPKEFGGEGLLKAHYYILCPLSMRYADPSYALTIMAHSSIGTTPILIALNQDIPRAKADLQSFLADASQIPNLKSKIQTLLRMLDSPEALKVKKTFTALGEEVKTGIGKKPMLRALASDFLRHFMDAGRAGLRSDIAHLKTELLKSLESLDTVRPRAESVVAELDRRAEAAKMFLRMISAGQISAFALTEPSAGSDSGGIQTRAELKRAAVFTDTDGKYFMLGNQRRKIVDAATVDVTNLPDCDIAQIRQEADREFYDYYELNGAKMWITNGHVAGVFCLYARTPEGPTGFLVRRASEGLVVGKDEEKMGQRGSPTNELSLNSVRVPRENIIGIEGRGQVNALETLNVGRTGLCVTATAMIAKIVEQCRPHVREPWQQQLLGEMAMELYACESLAYELIGRFDHHGTKDARTESAIGKYYASEVLHRVITAAEHIIGIEAVTQLHEIEKHRRDARVLNIYEGTNEVQRFLILRDLMDTVLPKATFENILLRDLKQAADAFGAQVWQNAGFQPTMFKLVEMAGYFKLMDSVRYRTQWLVENTGDADAMHRQIAEEACGRYLEFAGKEIQRLHAEFQREFVLLRQGLYPPSVRIAMLALQEEEHKKPAKRLQAIPVAGQMVVVMNVVPSLSPHPRVSQGELLETHFEFDAASRSALALALNAKPSRLRVIAVAPRFAVELLRRALAYGADSAVLLETKTLPEDPFAAARLIATRLDSTESIVCGDAILAAALSGNLGIPVHVAEPGLEPPEFRIEDYFHNKPVEIVDASGLSAEPVIECAFALPEAPPVEEQRAVTPDSAAALVRKLAGASDGEMAFDVKSEMPGNNCAVFLGAPGKLDGMGLVGELTKLPLHLVMFSNAGNIEAALRELQSIWKDTLPPIVAAGTWANELLARFANTFPRVQARFGVTGIKDGKLVMPVFGGKVQRIVALAPVSEHPLVATFSGGTLVKPQRIYHISIPEVAAPEAKGIADAEFIIDVGYALRDREHFDRIVAPLERRLREIGVKNVMVGGTRKVVEELKLLPATQQIGQTGTSVNPRVILSIGVSGAPQHVDYIGERATIIAFNKDAEAPLMTLNQRRARPRVVPIVGDLFETVPQFTAALKP